MAIVQTVDESIFVARFDEMNRSDNFSIPARRELFSFYDNLSDDTGEDIELDVIAICCDWSEMTMADIINEYSSVINVYRYVVDLDERGEYRASVYSVNIVNESEKCVANITGDMFEEFGILYGVSKKHPELIIDYMLEDLNKNNDDEFPLPDYYLTADDDIPDEIYSDIISELEDNTTVIEVEHYESETTYLVEAF